MKAPKQLPFAPLARCIASSLLCVLGMASAITTGQRTLRGTRQVLSECMVSSMVGNDVWVSSVQYDCQRPQRRIRQRIGAQPEGVQRGDIVRGYSERVRSRGVQ